MGKLTKGKFFSYPELPKAQFRIKIAKEPKPDETEFIVQQLLKFNSRCAREIGYKPLTIFLRDTNAKLVGELIEAAY